MLYTLLGLLALVGLAMIHPATRHVVGHTIAGLGLFTWAGIRATAPIVAWIVVGLTILIAVGIAFHNTALLATVAVLCGTITILLRSPLSLIPFGIGGAAKDKLGWWASLFMWIALLLLFVPQITMVTFLQITLIVIAASVIWLYSGGNLFRKIQYYSAWGIIVIVVTVALVAPARRVWTSLRYANLNQMAVTLTTESIEELQQRKIEKPLTWTTADQQKLAGMINLEDHQQANVEAAAARRTNLSVDTSGWSLPSFDDRTMLGLAIVLVVVGVCLKNIF
jgi:hypothetical protein